MVRDDISLEEFKKMDEHTRLYYIWSAVHGLDKRYASKLTEKVVYGMVGIIIASVLYALLAGVVKAAEFFKL